MAWWTIQLGDKVIAEFTNQEQANTAFNALLPMQRYGDALRLIADHGIIVRALQ